MTIQATVPVWHVQGDRQHEIGSAEVSLDLQTGEATISPPCWDDDAAARLDGSGAGTELECFLVLELDDAPDRAPLQVLAFPTGRYRLAQPTQSCTVRIPDSGGAAQAQ